MNRAKRDDARAAFDGSRGCYSAELLAVFDALDAAETALGVVLEAEDDANAAAKRGETERDVWARIERRAAEGYELARDVLAQLRGEK
jgi:hypothetical protein